jgi:hypothetical protein
VAFAGQSSYTASGFNHPTPEQRVFPHPNPLPGGEGVLVVLLNTCGAVLTEKPLKLRRRYVQKKPLTPAPNPIRNTPAMHFRRAVVNPERAHVGEDGGDGHFIGGALAAYDLHAAISHAPERF